MTERGLPITAFGAFIDVTEDTQIGELEEYLISKDINIEVNEEEGLESRIRKIVSKCGAVFSNSAVSPQELEGLLYCVASLFHLVEESPRAILQDLCRIVTTGATPDNARHRIRMLGLLFCQFEARDLMGLTVLKRELQFANEFNIGHLLNVSLVTLKKWMDNWKLSATERREVLMLFWNAVKSTSNRSLCTDTLIEILSLPSAATSEGSADLAKQLIVLALNDPSNYFFNTILQLEPVNNLQSEDQKIYKLLKLFVEGRLSSFKTFCETDRQFMENLGLSYTVCERKMQLLTLVSLAVESREVPFSALTGELQLDMCEVEQLIIDAIRQKLLKARIDHVNKRLVVMSCVHRTFDQEQWQLIYNRLSMWKQNISALRANLKTLQETPA